ncbi:DoxX family membrane protein [Pseudohaliea sp.]|uniref:DoxX family protein n=1 Tax=Pseudohaliea sp. TaxID=2740289 RepID=UPI0032EC9BA4
MNGFHQRLIAGLDGAALLLCRVSLAGVFWRAGRTKVEDGSWLTPSATTRFLFESEYSGVPLPTTLAMYLATWAEHLFPVLLLLGLATRFAALALLLMTLTIQVFVYPDAWWPVHSLWAAMALVLVSSGGGWLSLDHLLRGQRYRGVPVRA